MDAKRFARGDLMLIAALLIAGLAIIALLSFTRQDGRQAVVRANGQIVTRLPLAQDARVPVEIEGSVTNVVVVQDGAVHMEEADCPDHLCIRRGAIRYAGDSIICLPNKVVVEISGEDALNLDAVAG